MKHTASRHRLQHLRSLAIGSGAAALSLVAGCTMSADQAAVDAYNLSLAEHLTATGAKMYGAYWCPYCADQKDLFGNAVDAIPYVECDAAGKDPQPQLCQEKDIKAYPTWEINGEFYLGAHPLVTLAELSNFESQ
ncbi:MAG: hypothetical protein AAFX01_06430 [Cyanobacteria bacterium J06638_28]